MRFNFYKILLLALCLVVVVQLWFILGLRSKVQNLQEDDRWQSHFEMIQQNKESQRQAQQQINRFEAMNQWLLLENDSLAVEAQQKEVQLQQLQQFYHQLKQRKYAPVNYQDSSLMAIDEQLPD